MSLFIRLQKLWQVSGKEMRRVKYIKHETSKAIVAEAGILKMKSSLLLGKGVFPIGARSCGLTMKMCGCKSCILPGCSRWANRWNLSPIVF
jgi:hypothetical protein